MLISERNFSSLNSQNAFPACFETKLIRQQQLHIEVKHLIVRTNIWYYPHIDIRSLGTLNATFPSLLYAWLNLYSIGDEEGWQKIDNLPHRFGLLHHIKQIAIRPVFKCSPHTFCQFLLFFNFDSPKMLKRPFWLEREHSIVQTNEWFDNQQWY